MKNTASKKRRKLPLAALILICIACAAIALAAALGISSLVPDKTYRGSSISNIANGGMAVTDEAAGDVYYSNNGIFVKKQDEDAYMLTQERAQSLILVDGTLYFSNTGDANRCYAINVDGSGLKKLNGDISVEYLNEENGRLYFACVREIDKKGIYSMKTDGTDLKQEADVYPGSLFLYKNYFYYINKEKGNLLYRINRATGANERVTDKYTYCPVVSQEKNKLYYSYTDGIYEASLDGSFEKKLSESYANSIALTEEGKLVLVAFNYKADDGAGRYVLENSELKKIRDDEVMWLSVCSDKLYFLSMTKGFDVMRSDIDGQNGVYVAGGEEGSMLTNH